MPTPSRYLNRLAKHFEHRTEIVREPESTTLKFTDAVCTLSATAQRLNMRIESGSADAVSRYESVVTRHLKQVASQESFEVAWTRS